MKLVWILKRYEINRSSYFFFLTWNFFRFFSELQLFLPLEVQFFDSIFFAALARHRWWQSSFQITYFIFLCFNPSSSARYSPLCCVCVLLSSSSCCQVVSQFTGSLLLPITAKESVTPMVLWLNVESSCTSLMVSFQLSSQLFWCCCCADDCHVDDEDEAVEFINSNINNANAFVMDVYTYENEQDCSAVPGSNSMHEFRWVCLWCQSAFSNINCQVLQWWGCGVHQADALFVCILQGGSVHKLPEHCFGG